MQHRATPEPGRKLTGLCRPWPLMSIPVKWGTDSGEVGQRQSKATLAMAMISEVPHLSQEVRGS
jgi:hypothetical protein